MARTLNNISPATLRSALAGGLPPGMVADGGGLYLAIGPTGSAAWVYRYMRQGRARTMGLGGLADVAAPLARELAQRHRTTLALGEDPMAVRSQQASQAAALERQVNAQRTTFGKVAAAVLASLEQSSFATGTKRAWHATLRDHILPRLGHLTLDEIDRAKVLDVLRPLWPRIPVTAKSCRQRIEFIFDEARNQGLTDRPNPARWLDLKHGLAHYQPAQAPHKHAAMAWQDVPAFYRRLRAQDGYAPMALRLAILSGLRTREVLGARFDEFDPGGKIWLVPAGRMKGKPGARVDHRVPISSEIAELLADLLAIRRAGQAHLFPHRHRSHEHMSPTVMQRLLDKLELRGSVTIHGFRSTFRDWASDAGMNADAAERALAHKVTGVRAHYDRTTMLELRRDLMQQWSDYVSGRTTMAPPRAKPELRIVA